MYQQNRTEKATVENKEELIKCLNTLLPKLEGLILIGVGLFELSKHLHR
ncbi:hypothetical protein [Desulfosporosinus sp. SB140]